MIEGSEFLLEIKPDLTKSKVVPEALMLADPNIINKNTMDEFYLKVLNLCSELYNNPVRGPDLLREAWQHSSRYLFALYGYDNVYKFFNFYGRFSMDDDELEHLDELPDIVTLYRGTAPNDNSKLFMSCTFHDRFAEYYAKLHGGDVIKGNVSKSDILALYFSEGEVIIRPGAFSPIEQL